MAKPPDSLRFQIEMLERMAARVEGRRRPEDDRFLRAIAMLIADKQLQLERSEGGGPEG
jgi:hypothetical protein